jgi:hypothetical protein
VITYGVGLRRLREFNLALLGKWCWRMLVDPGACDLKCWEPVMGWSGAG